MDDGVLLAGVTSDDITIKGHMREDAGNEYQGLSIEGIAITVYATQYTYEFDSYGNQYDALAPLPWDGKTVTAPTKTDGVYHITNAAEFVAYIQAVGGPTDSVYTLAPAVLDTDIDLNGYTIERTGNSYIFAGAFDGNNHTVSNYTIKRTDSDNVDQYYTGLFGYLGETNGCTGSVKNLTVKNATVIGGKQVGAIVPSVNDNSIVENCHAYNCTVMGSKRVGSVVGYSTGTVNDCTATDCEVYTSMTESDMAGPVLGFNNRGTATGLVDTNVNVYFGAAFNTTAADIDGALAAGGAIFVAEDVEVSPSQLNDGTVLNLGGNTMAVYSDSAHDSKAIRNGGNITIKDGKLTGDLIVVRPYNNVETVVTFENVEFDYTNTNPSPIGATNYVREGLRYYTPSGTNNTKFIFKNCTFKNTMFMFDADSSSTPNFDVTFDGCTFDNFGSADVIVTRCSVTGTITIKDCTFNLTSTSGAKVVSCDGSSPVTIAFEGTNTVNGIAATAGNGINVRSPISVKVYSPNAYSTFTGLDTVTVTGIATK